MSSLPTACVIGAGSSGIAAVKALAQRGFDVTAFEKSDRVGGNWVWGNSNGMSSAYRSLHINTSRERMEYSDFPMPKSYPDFPHHTHIAKYFDDYVDHFGFRDRIRFETGVERRRAAPTACGRSRSTAARRSATTRCWSPTATTGTRAGPSRRSPGRRTSRACRSTRTTTRARTPTSSATRRVVVLGMGNSAMDIAVEASFSAERTYLAARRGAHVIPKYLFGKPIDQIGASPKIPFAVRRRVLEGLLKVYRATWSATGCPSPTTGSAPRTRPSPTTSSRAWPTATITAEAEHRRARPATACASPTAPRSRPTSSSTARATRSRSRSSTRASSRRPTTTCRCSAASFHPTSRTSSSSGCCSRSARSCRSPSTSRLGRDFLAGRYALPPRRDARRHRARAARMFKRYVASQRHTMQIDFDDYLVALARSAGAGEQRARAHGNHLPVPPRATPVAA